MHTITAHLPALGEHTDAESTTGINNPSASVSAAMDGELDDTALREWILSCKPDSAAAENWQTYHVIGDTLRQMPLNSSPLAEKVMFMLQDEPTVLAPQRKSMKKFVMPIAASVAAICLVGWSALNIPSGVTRTPVIAAVPMQMAKIDQTKLANFIAAHRDFSPGATSPFMDASFQVPAEPAR